MSLRIVISGHTITKYNKVNINRKYDSIASKFGLECYFDPDDQVHKRIFRPGTFQSCQIYYGGVLMLTGTILRTEFSSAGDPPRQLVHIAGYSITGILQECTIGIFQTGAQLTNDTKVPSQFDGQTLQQIAEALCHVFPLKVIVEKELLSDAVFNTPYAQLNIRQDQYIADFLNELCTQKNVVLSHDASGNLVITRAKVNDLLTSHTTTVTTNETGGIGRSEFTNTRTFTTTTSTARNILYDFSTPGVWTNMNLCFDGQRLHGAIQCLSQNDGSTSAQSTVINPYVDDQSTLGIFRAGLRIRRFLQTMSSNDVNNDTLETARSLLNAEIKSSICLNIDIHGWVLKGNLVTPNQLILAANKDLYLYTKTKWFIQEVSYYSDAERETASLSCVRPECFNDDPIDNADLINIFSP